MVIKRASPFGDVGVVNGLMNEKENEEKGGTK